MNQLAIHYAVLVTARSTENINQYHKTYVSLQQVLMRLLILAMSFFIFVAFSFAQKGTVTGTIRGLDGTLQGATVTAGKTSALTDNNGRFSLSLDPGNHTLVITHTGYNEAMQNLTIASTNIQAFDISLH